MATSLTLRGVKGTPLTHAELDANLTNLRDTADAALPATGPAVITSGSGTSLTINRTGGDDALRINDAGSGDTTPFVIDANGRALVGVETAGSSYVASTEVTPRVQISDSTADAALSIERQSGPAYLLLNRKDTPASSGVISDIRWSASDGTRLANAASVFAAADATPGAGSMPGRLVLSTTPSGSTTPTERLRIDSAGLIGVSGSTTANTGVMRFQNLVTGTGTARCVTNDMTAQSDVTNAFYGFISQINTAAASFTLAQLDHFRASPAAFGAGSAVTRQYGFHAVSTLTGAASNYGFYSNIASGTGRWNFYANGTAANYFEGQTTVNSGLTIGRTGVTSPAASDGNVFSGTYTPTLTNSTNISSSTAEVCQYMRVGNVVTVSIRVTIQPTATGGITLRISLPVASTFSSFGNAAGTCSSTTNNISGAMLADTAGNQLSLIANATTTASTAVYAHATYRVL
jgi:hypothetical protein